MVLHARGAVEEHHGSLAYPGPEKPWRKAALTLVAPFPKLNRVKNHSLSNLWIHSGECSVSLFSQQGAAGGEGL